MMKNEIPEQHRVYVQDITKGQADNHSGRYQEDTGSSGCWGYRKASKVADAILHLIKKTIACIKKITSYMVSVFFFPVKFIYNVIFPTSTDTPSNSFKLNKKPDKASETPSQNTNINNNKYTTEQLFDLSDDDFLALVNDPRLGTTTSKQDLSALFYVASRKGLYNTLPDLISLGVDPNDRLGPYSRAAIHTATHSDHIETVKKLIELGADINACETEHKATPLLIASCTGYTDIVELLIKNKASINTTSNVGNTALMFACIHDHKEVVSQLLNAGAEVDTLTNEGETPLYRASYNNNPEIVSLLLANNANTEIICPPDTCTALSVASYKGHLEVVRLLIKKNANIEATDKHGNTPLIDALVRGHTEVAIALLENNANPKAVSGEGKTAFDIAKEHNYLDSKELENLIKPKKSSRKKKSARDKSARKP